MAIRKSKAEIAIEKAEAELSALHSEMSVIQDKINTQEAKLSGMREMMEFYPKDIPVAQKRPSSQTQLRPGSDMDKARIAIAAAGSSLHITKIMIAIGRDSEDKKARVSIGSSLQAYARDGKIFTKVAPNTFGLIDMPASGSTGENDEIEF